VVATPPPFDAIRAVNRLAAPCILDAVMVGRLDRDFVDALMLAVVQAMQANFTDLQRMFSGFAQLGVLADWDRQVPPLCGVA
jgi:hypothetical protein